MNKPKCRYIYSPVQIAECGGPCEQGPEYCDCGELCVTEPEPEGPTDEELSDLWSWSAGQDQGPWPTQQHCFARAVLARWGNHPESPDSSGNLKAGLTRSPAAGEVAESAAWLRRSTGCADESPMDLRAADLLERLSPPRLAAEPPPPEQGQAFKDADTGVIYVRDGDQWLATQPVPQPVPVSERLPGPGDCDAEGRCWWWYPEVPDKTYGYWAYEDNAVPERALNEQPLHWLPAHALPLPS